jgi:Skp family chaperone for outer membrane proteins
MSIVRLAALAALCTTPFLCAQDTPSGGKSAVDAAAKSAPVQTGAAPLIGVVDLAKAFEQNPRYIRSKGELQKLADRADAQLGELTKTINEHRAALEQLEKGSEQYADAQSNIALMEQQRRSMVDRISQKLEIENARRMIEVYEDIEIAVKKVAERRGVAIVLRVHDMGPGGDAAKLLPKVVESRINGFERRSVWYASPEVDLTPDLIKFLMVPLENEKPGDTKPGDGKTNDAKAGDGKAAPESPKDRR